MYHTKSAYDVCKALNTDPNTGLSSREASKRLSQYGKNVIQERKRPGALARFFAQFSDFMTLILIAAAVISFIMSIIEGSADITEPVIILAIVFLNAFMGTVQEMKAEKSLDELKKLSSPHASVMRDKKVISIPSSEVVPGDILILKTGDIVSADARIIECRSLFTDESSLTGESINVEKSPSPIISETVHPGDMTNMVFASTAVTSGNGKAVVTATGMSTETGKIADLLLTDTDEKTPLEKRLDHTGHILGISALGICAVIFAIGITKRLPVFDMLLTSVSLAVAAIPEGLSAVVTVILAMGVARMAKRNAIIRTLSSTESLGSATVICTDKTGTLTENKMRVTNFYGDPKTLLYNSFICSDPVNANATEKAILSEIHTRGIRKDFTVSDIKPFNSSDKTMEVSASVSGNHITVIKGAPEKILEKCSKTSVYGAAAALTNGRRTEISTANSQYARQGLRGIAVAKKEDLGGFVFLGIIYLEDPVRKEAAAAVKTCSSAGIKTVMITGDHPDTALAVAKKAGIFTDSSVIVTGAELDRMNDSELDGIIDNVRVFARVTPSHKARIVNAFKNKGETVAMTGDGVNDAPSLKMADIGCSMGITGTEVAKSASDMILTDDNFSTIAEAVRIGRGIYDNIKKAVKFLLSSNIGEIMTVFSCLVMGWQTPLMPIQLLWVNLVTDSLPAVALGVDPIDKDIMRRPPVRKNEPLFSMSTMLLEGIMIGSLALMAFSIGRRFFDITTARTMTFTVLAVSQLFHAFNMRSEGSVFKAGIFKNHFLVMSLLIGIALQVSVIMIPSAAGVFGVCQLSPFQWLICALLAVTPILIIELQKAFSSKHRTK